MKNFIDRMSTATSEQERQEIVRETLNIQQPNYSSMVLGAIAGWLITFAFRRKKDS